MALETLTTILIEKMTLRDGYLCAIDSLGFNRCIYS